MNTVRVVIFAKAPVPGTVKTRLIPALGAEGAAALAREMLEHTIRAALLAKVGPIELCGSPAPDDPAWHELCLPFTLEHTAQGDGDLGQRMARATQRVLGSGQGALLIGTDCAEMSAPMLRAAARSLDSHDAVLHPTADGGYALLGLRRFAPSLFEDIPWSTPEVARLTRLRIAKLGWRLDLGRQVHDIDEARDLVHWKYSGSR